MADKPTNNEIFTPPQYNDQWSRNDLIEHYIDLYMGYCDLHGQFNHARTALPFQRERVIHNLQNRRILLENENRQLRLQIERLETTNATNDAIHQDLQREHADTQETLRDVINAQPGAYNDGTRRLKEERDRLRRENNELRTRVQTEPEWQTEARFANEIPMLKEDIRRVRAQKEATEE